MATVLNRNIITAADIQQWQTAETPAQVPRTLDVMPPGGAIAPQAGTGTTSGTDGAPGGVRSAVSSQDDYLTKLLKYVPLEVLGAYLIVAGLVDGNVDGERDRALWLLGLLVATLVATYFYDRQVLNVVRHSQVIISIIGMTVYVFSVGGWFATTTWYHPWYASIALTAFALLVQFAKVPPLPASEPADRTGTPFSGNAVPSAGSA